MDYRNEIDEIAAIFNSMVENDPVVNQSMALEGQGLTTEQCLMVALVMKERYGTARGEPSGTDQHIVAG